MVNMLTVPLVQALQESFFRGFCEMASSRRKANPVPNALFREVSSLNENATFMDQDHEFKKDCSQASSIILRHLNKLGFEVVPKKP